MKQQRYYSFWIVSYYTDITLFDTFLSQCKHYAYILHDKDETAPHYHFIVTFNQNKSFDSVHRLLPNLQGDQHQNSIVKPLYDKFGAFRYLTHKDNPEKFQYDDNLVVCSDINQFTKASCSTDNGDNQFLDDLFAGELTYREMAYKYGPQYYLHFRQLRDFLRCCHYQENILPTIPFEIPYEASPFEISSSPVDLLNKFEKIKNKKL